MGIEENKAALYMEIEEAWHKGNLGIIDDIYAPDFFNHSPFSGTTPDREGLKQGIKSVSEAFPDIRLIIEDLIAGDDKVVERVTAIGTHKKQFMGIEATNKQVALPIITINRFADGKIVKRWSISDSLSLLQQLDVIPTN